jgi:hypothetical protein
MNGGFSLGAPSASAVAFKENTNQEVGDPGKKAEQLPAHQVKS